MKKVYLMAGLLFYSIYGYSQILVSKSITYEYDANGSRIKRRPTLVSIPRAAEDEDPMSAIASMKEFKVYPNPTEGELIIEVSPFEKEKDTGRIIISDEQGRLIYEIKLEGVLTYIDLTAQKDGIYILYLECNGEKHSWKIIKE